MGAQPAGPTLYELSDFRRDRGRYLVEKSQHVSTVVVNYSGVYADSQQTSHHLQIAGEGCQMDTDCHTSAVSRHITT